jgi:tetratricopeptide (TPR) repeat protein
MARHMVLPRAALVGAISGVVMLFAAGARAAEAVPTPSFFEAELAGEETRLQALRGRPEAVIPLAAMARLQDALPPGRTDRRIEELADAPDTDPLVAAHASYLVSKRLDDKGDAAGAEARRSRLGFARRFWVIGPFGEGRASFFQPFPPEAERAAPERTRRYAGKEREVAWRDGSAAVRQGALYLDGLLRPDNQAVAYVVTFVRSDRRMAAALRLGSAGPVKVWCNGQLVHSKDVVRAVAMDQDAVGVTLRPGWNRILIKTVITEGAWRIFLRVSDPAGRGLPAAVSGAPAPGDNVAGAVAGSRRAAPVVVRNLEAVLRARAIAEKAGSGGAGDPWLDLGRYLAWLQPADREAREEVAAFERSLARQPSVRALLELSEVARDEDERRQALERALTLVPEGPWRAQIMVRLGDVANAQRRGSIALHRWREAMRLDPGCWPAAMSLAEEEEGVGMPLLALARVDALPASVRTIARITRYRAKLLAALDRRDEADRVLVGLHADRRHDAELTHELAMRARAVGDAGKAVALLRRAAELRPDVVSFALDLARTLEGTGQAAAALTALEALVERMPDEPLVLAHLGKLLHRQGRRPEALQRLRTALALKPQDVELRRYTDRLSAETQRAALPGQAGGHGGDDDEQGEDLARRYAFDARSLLAAEARPRERGTTDPDPAVVLLDRRVVRVHRNGLSETFAQRVVQIRTDRGAEDNKEFFVRYTPGVEEVEVRQARIFRRGPAGEIRVLEASERDDQDLSEPWYGLYYDYRAEVVRFEGLRAGDVLEVQYSVADVSSQNQLADYFGDLQFIAEGIPKRRWEYILLTPVSRTFHTNSPAVTTLESQVKEEGGQRIQQFVARDIPKLDVEPAMPGYAEVGPYLHVSTYASWKEVGAWYWRLIEEQLAADDSVRRAAQSVIEKGMTTQQKVRAIHNLVVTGTRYVGLEFGIHGYKPYRVTQVLSRKFGDCKDKAALLMVLLREVGVEAELVLVRTRRGGKIATRPASLAVFDHAIAYIPKLDMYLDGTAEFAGTAELPDQDQGVMVLRVGREGATLTETPVLPSAHNRAQRRWTVDVHQSGDAKVAEQLLITGQAAPDWREHYQTQGERADRYEKVWTARHPGAKLLSVDMPGIDNRNQPVTVRALASIPRLGQMVGAGGEMELPIAVREGDFSRTYARLSARTHDLIVSYPWQHAEDLTFRLPEGWRIERVPETRRLESPFGQFHLEVTREGDREVRVRSLLDVTQHRISPEDYGRFRQFLGDIDVALAGRIVLQKSGR